MGKKLPRPASFLPEECISFILNMKPYRKMSRVFDFLTKFFPQSTCPDQRVVIMNFDISEALNLNKKIKKTAIQ
jgi:hypothetical protein